MRYLMIFRSATEADVTPSQEEIDAMGAFMSEMGERGYLLAADGVLSSASGLKIRRSGEDFELIDGPFTEAKEVIAGFAVVDVPDRTVAIDIAKRFMVLGGDGEIEVREMHPEPAFPPRA
ncbi:MAG: YciI family protein [Tepidiformaceae bacterium]